MKIIDAHCHLESEEFENNLDEIIRNARDAGICKLITSSITPGQWEKSKSIAEKYKEVEFALGVHPWYATPSDLDMLENLKDAKTKGAAAIGEIGLDEKIENPSIEIQTKIFEIQLSIAKEINLPVIVHCRGAFDELISSIKKIGVPEAGGIIHSFSGSAGLADSLIKLGLSFSIGGILTYKKNKKRIELLERIYPNHFLLETDSPDIPPIHLNGKPNVPSNILFNLKAASDLLGIKQEDIAETTTANAVRIFNLVI